MLESRKAGLILESAQETTYPFNMRVVYDYGQPKHLPVTPSPGTKSEDVLVIKLDKNTPKPSAAYDVKISDEAVARNQEVRAHEQAHMAVLGSAAASGIQYNTVTGPDGETIAVGGKIAVDMSPVPGDPEATLRKAQAIIAAAYAPGVSSGADLRTAAQAAELARQARQDLRA